MKTAVSNVFSHNGRDRRRIFLEKRKNKRGGGEYGLADVYLPVTSAIMMSLLNEGGTNGTSDTLSRLPE